jgi:kynurenine 3-monooxygenase
MNKLDRFDFSQSYLEHGYKELTIPPTAAGDFAMEPNALHIWPRGAFMMIALPNQDRSFTCTCFWPFSGPPGFDALKTPEQIRSFFKERFSDAVPLMPTLVQDFQANPTSSLVTMRCWPWVYRDKAALLGDAAHAIVPFYGQGMNAAFEDCVVLAECAERSGSSWCKALAEYQSRRKPNTDAIADMALENFIEMRDHVASRTFLLKKKLGHAMHRLFPRAFVPLYNMVSFSTIPYAEARKRADLQSKIVRGLGIGLLAIVILLILALVSRRAR